MRMKVVGIDLAGSEKRPTGFCILDGFKAKTMVLYTDREIIAKVKRVEPVLVAIDAPLTLPEGRKSLKEKSNIHFRKCDRELAKLGIKFFPITLGPMRMLTERGIRLKKVLKKYKVIEVYPGAAQDIWEIPRKQKGLEDLKNGLKKLGVKGINDVQTGDELDAVTAALVGKLYLENKYVALGDRREGQIIIPKF